MEEGKTRRKGRRQRAPNRNHGPSRGNRTARGLFASIRAQQCGPATALRGGPRMRESGRRVRGGGFTILLAALCAVAWPSLLRAQSLLTAAGRNNDSILATVYPIGLMEKLAIAPNGDVFMTDPSNARVLKVSGVTGILSVFAGTGIPGLPPPAPGRRSRRTSPSHGHRRRRGRKRPDRRGLQRTDLPGVSGNRDTDGRREQRLRQRGGHRRRRRGEHHVLRLAREPGQEGLPVGTGHGGRRDRRAGLLG